MLRRCVWSRNIKNRCSICIYDISNLRVNFTLLLFYPWRETPEPIEQDSGCASEAVWAFLRKKIYFYPTGIRTLERPPRSLSWNPRIKYEVFKLWRWQRGVKSELAQHSPELMASLQGVTQSVHVRLTCANAAPSSALRRHRTLVTMWDPYWAKCHCHRFLSESLPFFLFANHNFTVASLRHANRLLCDWQQQAELNRICKLLHLCLKSDWSQNKEQSF